MLLNKSDIYNFINHIHTIVWIQLGDQFYLSVYNHLLAQITDKMLDQQSNILVNNLLK